MDKSLLSFMAGGLIMFVISAFICSYNFYNFNDDFVVNSVSVFDKDFFKVEISNKEGKINFITNQKFQVGDKVNFTVQP